MSRASHSSSKRWEAGPQLGQVDQRSHESSGLYIGAGYEIINKSFEGRQVLGGARGGLGARRSGRAGILVGRRRLGGCRHVAANDRGSG